MAINILEETATSRPERWRPTLLVYDALKAGSIDGTDSEPHDRAIWRAMHAKYKPPKNLPSDPDATIFVGRLNKTTVDSDLQQHFRKYGEIIGINLIRDIVTGFSKCYAFIEFAERRDARDALRANGAILDQKQIMVEMECGRKMKGWVPRRLGGGFCGKKESGQLRFGGNQKPFKRPIHMVVEDRKRLQEEFGTLPDRDRSFSDEQSRSFGRTFDRGGYRGRRGGGGYAPRGYPHSDHRRETTGRYDRDRRGFGAPRSRFGEDDGYNEKRIAYDDRSEYRGPRRTREYDNVHDDPSDRRAGEQKPKEYIMLYNNLRSMDELRNPPPPPPPSEEDKNQSKNPRDREQSFRTKDEKEKNTSDSKREKLKKIDKARKEQGIETENHKHPDWEFYDKGKW